MKKKGNVFVYIVLVAAVLLTKVLGLARNMLLSSNYGTSIEAAAFIAVSNLPLIIFDVTFGTAISAAFVPVFIEKMTGEGKDASNRFASNFINVVLLASFVLVALGIAFPKLAVAVVASGFDGDGAMAIAISLIRIIMPIISFACCTFIFVGILQSCGEFIAPALVSLFSNLSMIVYLLFLDSKFGIKGLAVAFCIGWFLQFSFLIPFLKQNRFKYSFGIDLKSKDLRKVVVLTLPLFVAALAQPINQLISSNFSSSVSDNSVATVNYAYNAYFIVAGVFSYALTNMFFPEMSRRFASKDVNGATEICKDMLSTITAIIIPITAFMCACSTPIIRILYQRGEFTSDDTLQVSVLLSIYTLGMIFLSWQDILNKYFYSMQKGVIPMIVAAVGVAANFTLSMILTPQIGLKGLALSTVISGLIMTVLLVVFSLKYTKKTFRFDFVVELLKIFISGIIVFILCKYVQNHLNFDSNIIMQIIFIGLIFAVAVVSYLLLLLIFKSKNLSKIINLLKRR